MKSLLHVSTPISRWILCLGLIGSTMLLSESGQALTADVRFEYITTVDGLSGSSVTAIAQDHEGFLFIGTQEGLNKYDGYQFTIYRNSPLDSTTLTDSRIESLLVDHAGTLWIGTTVHGRCA
jgi:ligand-binding sensor domain-containing protein